MTTSYKIYLMGFRVFATLALALSAFGPWQTTQVFADKLVCGIPGIDGPLTLNGVVNTYYPGVGNASAGGTSISVGSPSGAAQTIQVGDLLLVIQMQGAEIDSSNTGAYGNGVAGDPATGNLSNVNFTAGQYEYVIATSAVVAGSVSISSGLANNYSTQNYPVGAGNQGQRRFQVIRVPQYSSATITTTVRSLAWNGSVGGVVALDVAGALNFSGGSINVNGQGFRGGGGVLYTGATVGADTDYRTLSTTPVNASKGEGTAGTPRYIFNGTAVVDLGALLEGYPNGSFGRGAPGNAGGGGTDGGPFSNAQNTGGGGGSNGGGGGKGGIAYSSQTDGGGFGGTAFPVTPFQLIMGGAGGAGAINNNNPVFSSGGAGGGIVMIRAGTIVGNGTVNANGADGQEQPLNDSGGGAGAGGSVLVLAQNGTLPAALNVNANGGNGGDAWLTQASGDYPGERHGPGGGGGGGVIYLSSTAGTLSANRGTNGLTTDANDSYGSTPGSVGVINTGVTPSQTPNSISGPGCIPNPSVVKTTSTPSVVQTPTGTSGTYTIVVTIPANQGTALGFTISDSLPTGFSYASTTSITPSAGVTYTPNVNPSLGDTAPRWGTFDIPGGGQVSITFTVNIAASVLPGTYQNPAIATYTDPTRTVANGTTTTSYNYLTDLGEDITVTATLGPALTIVKSVTETSYATVGTVLHYSYLVTNSGNVALVGLFTVTDDKSTDETCPATTTLAPGASITCTATYTVTQADLNAGSVTNIASAHGSFNNTPVDSPTATKTVNATQGPALTIVKSVTETSFATVGTVLHYSYLVTNNGNVTLNSPFTVTDDKSTDETCPATATLAPGASITCTATYTVTQADLNAGSVTNIASAHGSFNNTPINSPTDTKTINATQGPALTIVKSVTETSFAIVGTVLHYSYLVTNSGNVSLVGPFTVTDDKSTDETCPATATLAPGASITCTATYTVTQADLNAGSVTNIASAHGSFNNTPVNSPTDTKTVIATQGPALTIVKNVTETSFATVGTVLHYSYLVTNSGTVTLNGPFTVTDDKSTDETCPATPTLASGASITCTATYTVTQADLNAGSVTNIASAHGSFNNTPIDSPTATKTVAGPQADLSLTKTVNNLNPAFGIDVTFTLTVTNVGPDPATGVQVGDLLPAGFTFVSATPGTGTYDSNTGVWSIGALAVNASASLTVTATVNPTGPYVNTAQITASDQVDPDSRPNNNNPNEDDQASATVTPAQGTVTKNADIASARIGEIVTYTVSVVIPSGTFNNVRLVDTMDRGLSFMACDGITAGSLTTSIVDPNGLLPPLQYICANPTVDSNGSADPVDVGRRVTFDFGTLTNATGTNQNLIVTYRAVVLDSAGNQNAVNVRNSAQVSWTGSNNPPASSTVRIVEPDLSISKTSNNTFIANGTTVTFFITTQHTAASTADAYDVVVTDVLPTPLDFVTGSLDCTPGAQDPAPCAYDPGTRTITATWSTLALAGGTGQISFQAAGNANLPANGSVTNVGSVAWTSLPGDLSQPQSPNQFSTERYYDPNDPNQINTFGASASLNLSPLGGGDKEGPGNRNDRNAQDIGQGSGGFLIPITGFAPGRITDLSGLPVARYDANLDLSLEIPRLKLNIPIVGASLKDGAWDVNWLTNQAGWLEKTAFPGFAGNSVLTGHATSSYGAAGPFASLYKLQEGDLIFIHTFGQTQIYKVQAVKKVQPNDISVLNHQEKPWLTLLTCANYDEKTNQYLSRVVVKAELIEVRDGNISGR